MTFHQVEPTYILVGLNIYDMNMNIYDTAAENIRKCDFWNVSKNYYYYSKKWSHMSIHNQIARVLRAIAITIWRHRRINRSSLSLVWSFLFFLFQMVASVYRTRLLQTNANSNNILIKQQNELRLILKLIFHCHDNFSSSSMIELFSFVIPKHGHRIQNQFDACRYFDFHAKKSTQITSIQRFKKQQQSHQKKKNKIEKKWADWFYFGYQSLMFCRWFRCTINYYTRWCSESGEKST